MPAEITALIARSSVGRALDALRAWSDFGARLRQLRRGVGVSIQFVERRSGLPLLRLIVIEAGTAGTASDPDIERPPTDDEIRAYLSALDAEPEPWLREAERIRKEHG